MIDPKALDALYATLGDIQAANQPVEVTKEPKPVVSIEDMTKTNTESVSSEKPNNLLNDFRNYLLSVLSSNEQQQLDDTIASQVQPDPMPATPETVKNMVELERTLTGLTKATPTFLKEQIKNAIPVNLITQEELDKQTSMKQPQAKIEESLDFDAKEQPKEKTEKKPIASQSDFIVDDYFLSHFKDNEGIKYNLGPGAEGGKTDDIAHGHKLLGDEITTKMVYGIDVSKGVTDEQSDTIARFDIQGERGVNRATREFNQVMKENNIKKDFKDLEKWKQNLLVDFSLNNAPSKNLAKALANDNITDIVENATDRTFKRANKKGVLVRRYQSKRNEDTYRNLIEPFIKDSVSEEKLKYYLEEVLKRKGPYSRKKHNKIK
tara:strand:+ start:23 stop:1156 length:1134 start_codon:yes stop_codon:yes gene_type:complete